MRLINVMSGKIILDDIELATVAGSVVRQKFNLPNTRPVSGSGFN